MLLPSPSPFLSRLRALRRRERKLGARAFAILFVATFLLQAGAMLALNLVANPRSEFPTEVVEPLKEDERGMKLRALARMEEAPEVLIVGSSRSWGIDPASFTTRGYGSAYNAGIGSATTFDTLEVYRHVVREQGAPRLLFVAFEDWQLVEVHQAPLDVDAPTGLADVRGYAPALLRSLHLDYLKDSVRAIRLEVEGHPPRTWEFLPGGNVVWEREELARAAGATLFEEELERHRSYGHEHYGKPADPARAEALRTLVREARAAGTEVVLVLTPLHPRAYDTLPADVDARIAEARALAIEQCAEGARVLDLTDPASYGSDLAGFVDGWHYTAAEGDRIVAHALAAPGLCGPHEQST